MTGGRLAWNLISKTAINSRDLPAGVAGTGRRVRLRPVWAERPVGVRLSPSARRNMEDSPSGLWRRPAKAVGHRVPREFDSHILRWSRPRWGGSPGRPPSPDGPGKGVTWRNAT